MKATRKSFTINQKRQAIKDVKELVSKGNTATMARHLVGQQLDVFPGTIYKWQRLFKATPTTKASTSLINSVDIRTSNGKLVRLTPTDIANIAKLAGHVH